MRKREGGRGEREGGGGREGRKGERGGGRDWGRKTVWYCKHVGEMKEQLTDGANCP